MNTESIADLKRLAHAKHGNNTDMILAKVGGRDDRKATWQQVIAHPLLTNEQIADHRQWQRGLRDRFPWLPPLGDLG